MTVNDITIPRTYGHFIDGEWRGSSAAERVERRSPFDGRSVADFAAGTREDAEVAVASARRAFDHGPWPRMSGQARSRVLLDLAAAMRADRERLARIEVAETGKPIAVARGDLDGAISHVEFAAGLAQSFHGEAFTNLGEAYTGLVLREPAGVVAAIVPWNFPALILCQKVPYALAAGCTVVAKPSEMTSGTALEIARLAAETGLPPGALNVVTGLGHVVGQTLAEHPDVDFLSFTGSTATGQRVIEASAPTVKRLGLELGGKAASIVFADADLDAAADAATFAVFFNNGECCVSGARLLVQDSIAEEFIAAVVDRARQLRVGDPFDESTDVGPLITPEHRSKVLSLIRMGAEDGGRTLLGDSAGDADGCFVAPTILDDVSRDSRLFHEEVFGPVLSVTRFSDRREALELANAVPYGLANTVWTKDVDTALTLSRGLRSGVVWVNTTIDLGPQLPLSGRKASGYGSEMGAAGLEEFTQRKTVNIRTGPHPRRLRTAA
jgi:betaine-aldehyde dehydrogenase